jgi:hypothetical protein
MGETVSRMVEVVASGAPPDLRACMLGAARQTRSATSPIHPERVGVDMWQLFLERFVPVMEDDPSLLDVRDGVGASLAARSGGGEPVGAVPGGDTSVLPHA